MANVFVFGSNLAGRHGMGAAKTAIEAHGAVYGIAEGRVGNSYAIPTKDKDLKTLRLATINASIAKFLTHARTNPEDLFILTPIGSGLAGYKINTIIALFRKHHIPQNVLLTATWLKGE